MPRFHPTRRHALGLIAGAALPWQAAHAAAWPEKPIKLIVTFAPGGASDIVARVVGEQLAKKLGQPVIVDNRPGAGGTVGGQLVASSPADGCTLMLSNTTPNALGPYTLDKPPYDPLTAFTHVANLGSAPLLIMASKQSGLKKLPDLIAKAKAENGLNFGSGGPGSVGHIEGERIRHVTGVPMTHVPYRGGAPMTTDLIAGLIPVGIDVITAFAPFVKKGDIVALAVTGAQRAPLLPDVPTVAEAGQPNLRFDNFFGLSGPARLPADVVARLNTVCNDIVADPAVAQRLADLAITPHKQTAAEFGAFVREQVQTLGPLVKSAGVKL